MLVNATNITEKTYSKLVLRVGLDGFSFCVFDTLQNKAVVVGERNFADFPKSSRVEDYFWKAFIEEPTLTKEYDEVVVLHKNSMNTFVPDAVFDEEYLGSYLQYNTKVFETDYFASDVISKHEMHNVYIPYININNFLIDQFGRFDYLHNNTVLVSTLLDSAHNTTEMEVFVHFDKNQFSVIAIQNRKLQLFNSFDYTTKEDFIYYLLFTCEQLKLNPETFTLHLLGDITEETELFKIAYKYVRNVTLFNLSMYNNNDFSDGENRKHFILFNS